MNFVICKCHSTHRMFRTGIATLQTIAYHRRHFAGSALGIEAALCPTKRDVVTLEESVTRLCETGAGI